MQSVEKQTSELSIECISQGSTFLTPREITIENLNQSLKMMDISPVNVKNLRNEKSKIQKLNEIVSAYKTALNKISPDTDENYEQTEGEILFYNTILFTIAVNFYYRDSHF